MRGLLADAVKRGDQEEALALAKRAYERSPNTSWVLTTYFDLLTLGPVGPGPGSSTATWPARSCYSGTEATRRRAL